MSKFTEKLAKVTGGSPLEKGHKYETDELVGKKVHFNAVDIVRYHDPEKDEDVAYTVWATSDGYYRGGKQLSDIHAAICTDEELLEEFTHSGITVVLSLTKTKAGQSFVKVTVIDNEESAENYDIC